jgi:hypothetical protein
VVFTDQGKPPKTTNNTDEKGDGNERNEDADSPAPDKPLDVGEHYVVRRPDGSLREFFYRTFGICMICTVGEEV